MKPIILKTIIIILFLFSLKTAFCAASTDITNDLLLIDQQIQREVDQTESQITSGLLSALHIQPRMNVLNIGAGSGQYAYAIAEKMAGEGIIYALDINESLIPYIAVQARARGLGNIFPRYVSTYNFENIINEQYDLILISSPYDQIPDKNVFFRKLKSYLKPDGRLAVFNKKVTDHFRVEDIPDNSEFINELLNLPPSGPFYLFLPPSTLDFLQGSSEKSSLEETLLNYFNIQLLENHSLYGHFIRDGQIDPDKTQLLSEELMEANSILNSLLKKGSLDPMDNFQQVTNYLKGDDREAMMRLNKILITQQFRKYLNEDTEEEDTDKDTAEYELQGKTHGQPDIHYDLQSAGYSLEEKFDAIPFNILLIFKPLK